MARIKTGCLYYLGAVLVGAIGGFIVGQGSVGPVVVFVIFGGAMFGPLLLFLPGLIAFEIYRSRSLSGQIRSLKFRHEGWRFMGCQLLGLRHNPIAVEPLLEALKDENVSVRKAAIWALGQIGGEKARQGIKMESKDTDKHIRMTALSALGNIRDVEPIKIALEDTDSDIRRVALDIIEEKCWKELAEDLIPLLKDDNEKIKRKAVKLIGLVGSDSQTARNALEEYQKQEEEYKKQEELKRRLAEEARRVAQEMAAKTVRRGGFNEPYCSDECYNKAGAEIGRSVIFGIQGVCGFCERGVQVTPGSSVKLIPYRGKFLFICSSCEYRAIDYVRSISECCECGNSLS